MKTFLEQPRRGKTHKVLITPHKAKPQCGVRQVPLQPQCGDERDPRRGKTREALITPHKAKAAVWGETGAAKAAVSDKASAATTTVRVKARTAIVAMCCVIIMAVLCTACDCDKKSLTGDYSYKLSGEVVLTNADGEVTYRLIHRNGQMNILKDKSQKSRYIITMNEMSGGCYTMTAELRGDSLLIDQHTFQTNILSTNSIPDLDIDLDLDQDEDATIVYRVSAAGGGSVNGNILILTEVWTGKQSGNSSATLNGPEMTIIAEKN